MGRDHIRIEIFEFGFVDGVGCEEDCGGSWSDGGDISKLKFSR